MARKTVRVEIPVGKPDEFAKLLKRISEQNTKLGTNSPLKSFSPLNMSVYETKRTEADNLRNQADSLRKESEKKMEQARIAYGTGKGQSVTSIGTLYNMLDSIKDFLLVFYKGNEEALSEWGFNVVVGNAKGPAKKIVSSN